MTILESFLGFFSLFSPKPSRQVMRRAARIDQQRSLDAATGARRARGMGTQPSLQADVHGLAPRVATRARYQAGSLPADRLRRVGLRRKCCGLRIEACPSNGRPLTRRPDRDEL